MSPEVSSQPIPEPPIEVADQPTQEPGPPTQLPHQPPLETTPSTIEATTGEEIIDPRHTYLAYVYDTPIHYREDITAVVEQAQAHGYPVRYWWLSEAIPIGDDYPDRLIICAHCPSSGEDAGLDLYQEADISWEELEVASVEEYRRCGKAIRDVSDIFMPDSKALFPEISSYLSYSATHGLSSVLLVLADLRMKQFSLETRENMRLSLQRLSQLFLMLLGNTEKFEKVGQTPEQTFAYLAGLIREMTSYYQLLGDGLLSADEDAALPF